MLACAIMASSLLVEITPASHAVRLDIVYATARNFTGAPVYRRPACFLHPDAAACLARAVDLAASREQWPRWDFDCDGAARSAALIAGLIEGATTDSSGATRAGRAA